MIHALAIPSPDGAVFSEVAAADALRTSQAESGAMHAYIGVNCKQCQTFIAFREIARGTEIDDAMGDHQLSCAKGHQNTYALGDFYTLESSTSYVPSSPSRHGGPWGKFGPPDSGRELRLIALALALVVLVVWRYF